MDIDKRDFERQLKQALEKESGLRIGEPNEIPFEELFPTEFMQLYTDFDSIETFFAESPWEVEGHEDFKAIPDAPFDEYVDEHTNFPRWEVMYETAGQRFFARKFS